MSNIFISYRRDDSADVAGHIYKRLNSAFGAKRIFMDVDSIQPGEDFRTRIKRTLERCNVVLVVIGRDWLEMKDQSGCRRIENPDDYVRIEIELALERKTPLMPVLVENANVPKEKELPESIRELAFRHATPVRPIPDFDNDIERLIRGIENLGVATAPEDRDAIPRPLKRILGIAALILLSGVIAMIIRPAIQNPDEDVPIVLEPDEPERDEPEPTMLDSFNDLVLLHEGQRGFVEELEKVCADPEYKSEFTDADSVVEDACEIRKKVKKIIESLKSRSHKNLILFDGSPYDEIVKDMVKRERLLDQIIEGRFQPPAERWKGVASRYKDLYSKLKDLREQYREFLKQQQTLPEETSHRHYQDGAGTRARYIAMAERAGVRYRINI